MAGLFDGEGNCTISLTTTVCNKEKFNWKKRYYVPSFQVTITNTDKPVLKWTNEKLGVSSRRTYGQRLGISKKTCYNIRLRKKATIIMFIEAIAPYTKIKTVQLQIFKQAMDWCEFRNLGTFNTMPINGTLSEELATFNSFITQLEQAKQSTRRNINRKHIIDEALIINSKVERVQESCLTMCDSQKTLTVS